MKTLIFSPFVTLSDRFLGGQELRGERRVAVMVLLSLNEMHKINA